MRRILLALLASLGVYSLSIAGAASLITPQAGTAFLIKRSWNLEVDNQSTVLNPCTRLIESVVPSLDTTETYVKSVQVTTTAPSSGANNCTDNYLEVYVYSANDVSTSSVQFVSLTVDTREYARATASWATPTVKYKELQRIKLIITDN